LNCVHSVRRCSEGSHDGDLAGQSRGSKDARRHLRRHEFSMSHLETERVIFDKSLANLVFMSRMGPNGIRRC